MRAGRKFALLMAATAVMSVFPMMGAGAQTAAYTVMLGGDVPRGFSTRAFAPLDHGVPTINVNTGDVVNLLGGGIVLPTGTGPTEWHSENTQEVDSPFGFFLSDPDPDLEGVDAPYKFNIAGIDTPTDADCGATADAPCSVNGTQLVSGGNRFEATEDGSWFIQVNSLPGSTLWVTSAFNHSRLSTLKINVVTTGEDTQEEIDVAADEMLEIEQDSARALHTKLSETSTKHKTASGQTVWDVHAGYDTQTFALFEFYPKRLKIREGDKVRWHFSELSIEQHGLAFPFKKGIDIANNKSFIPACDPDGDTGEAADVMPNFETFSCDDAGHTLEFDVDRAFTAESGDGRFPGGPQRIENSGFRGHNIPNAPGIAGGTDPWDLTFTKTSSDKGYRYVCTFHGRFMNATVVVR